VGSNRDTLRTVAVVAVVISVTLGTVMMLDSRTRLGPPLPKTPAPKLLATPASPSDRAGRGTFRTGQPNSVIYEQQFSFVTRSGSQLQLDGQPYRFSGLNIYNANNVTYCWYALGSGPKFDAALSAIGSGQSVFRTWFFQPLATTNGQRDWSTFDHTLMVARMHGERVIATLGNEWNDCDGGSSVPRYKNESWFASGYRTQRIPGTPSTYRDWVAEVVSRYRLNPTIMAWQLMNEAATPSDDGSGRCTATSAQTLRNFAVDMAGVIKSIDKNHLVSLGTIGAGECGTNGANYQYVYSAPGIDLCEMHDYGPASALMPTDPNNGLLRRIAQCRALNKPLFVGEAGLTVSSLGSIGARASAFDAKMSAQFAAGSVGELIWDWCDADQVAYSGYEITPGDPTLAVLTKY
jgi:hypothetical protein